MATARGRKHAALASIPREVRTGVTGTGKTRAEHARDTGPGGGRLAQTAPTAARMRSMSHGGTHRDRCFTGVGETTIIVVLLEAQARPRLAELPGSSSQLFKGGGR